MWLVVHYFMVMKVLITKGGKKRHLTNEAVPQLLFQNIFAEKIISAGVSLG